MFGLVAPVYIPNENELLLLREMADGKKPDSIQETLKLQPNALNQMQGRLRLKLGVETNDQMMCEYGKYLTRNAGKHPYDVMKAAQQNISAVKP